MAPSAPRGPAGAELGHRTALRRPDDAVGLGSDEALVVQAQQHEGLDELGLDGRGPHGEDGLPREDGGALRHGPDVAGETELAQIVQEGLGKAALGAEVGDVLLVKAQLLDILDDLGQPRRYSKASLVRDRAEEHVKVADALAQSGLEVPVAHGELIEVAQHGQICLFFHPWGCLLFGEGMLRSRPRGCQHPCVFSLLYLEKREKAREKGAGPGFSGGYLSKPPPEGGAADAMSDREALPDTGIRSFPRGHTEREPVQKRR